MPWPARITGRFELWISSSACAYSLRRGRKVGTVTRQLRLGRFPVELARPLLRILGDIDQHRPGTTRLRHVESLADGARHFARVRHQIIVLGDRERHAGDVNFLKRVRPNQLAAHLSGDADDGRGIEHGGGESGDRVGRSRPRGCHRYSDPSTGAREAVGHVGCALFVAHQHMMDLAVPERVISRQNGAAGIAEDLLHPFPLQAFPENARAGHRRLVPAHV